MPRKEPTPLRTNPWTGPSALQTTGPLVLEFSSSAPAGLAITVAASQEPSANCRANVSADGRDTHLRCRCSFIAVPLRSLRRDAIEMREQRLVESSEDL